MCQLLHRAPTPTLRLPPPTNPFVAPRPGRALGTGCPYSPALTPSLLSFRETPAGLQAPTLSKCVCRVAPVTPALLDLWTFLCPQFPRLGRSPGHPPSAWFLGHRTSLGLSSSQWGRGGDPSVALATSFPCGLSVAESQTRVSTLVLTSGLQSTTAPPRLPALHLRLPIQREPQPQHTPGGALEHSPRPALSNLLIEWQLRSQAPGLRSLVLFLTPLSHAPLLSKRKPCCLHFQRYTGNASACRHPRAAPCLRAVFTPVSGNSPRSPSLALAPPLLWTHKPEGAMKNTRWVTVSVPDSLRGSHVTPA